MARRIDGVILDFAVLRKRNVLETCSVSTSDIEWEVRVISQRFPFG
jgi:hypothetical protein